MNKYTEEKLDHLENSIRLLKNVSAILYSLVTTDKRGQTLYNSLQKVENLVKDTNDATLMDQYSKLLAVFLSGVPQQQILPDDYFDFLQGLGILLNKAVIQANEADIEIREAFGLQSVIGMWGGLEWEPSEFV